MDAVILAGGRGERLGTLTKYTPKPLIKVGNKSVIEHQILLLRRYGIRNIWILSGYFGEKIRDYLGDGTKYGLRIKHVIEKEPLGTAGALKQMQGLIENDFLVISGDVMMDIEIKSFIDFHHRHKEAIATIAVHPSDHPFDSDLVQVEKDGLITKFLSRKDKKQPNNLLFKNLTNAGVFIISQKIFKYIKKNSKSDLELNLFVEVLKLKEKIFAYKTPEYVKDMGTIERLNKVSEDLKCGKIQILNLKNKRPAIFLDRDGTINKRNNIKGASFSNFSIFPFAAKAIKQINESGYLAIVITNQGALAKGFITPLELEMTHMKLETEIARQGAFLDGIYFCPHHPDEGFEYEIKPLKINCSCRKPKIGLIKKAVKDFNIDLKKSYFIGDTSVDAKTAENAGLRFIGVSTGLGMNDGKINIRKSIKIVKNLREAVNQITNIPYF